ncbi:hypothetical protein [Streptomyces sp. NBC_00316]|uniref:hypothetical protein n=1 Tax=Streptomyces sp. NBC_00316 TaxID=2975710 RepID=UPI002E2982B7|nr:hypothetical protein [Streptomyces sp. NBC_00316]
MDTERPDNDVTRPRRRRSPLAVASVAAAVLLAGGGGAYWAATAADGESSPPGGRGDAPPLLVLDETPGGPDSRTTPPEGIAVGEPDPSGGSVFYRAAGKLPDGPAEAAVHRAHGTVSAAEVARLAKALGVAGTPQAEGTTWKVGSDGDGTGPVLRVNKQAPGTWTFARYGSGGTDSCESATVCSSKDMAPGGTRSPVGEKAAKAAAAPVLKAVGQDDAALDARQLMGSVRVVNADPVVDGLPTYGWATGIQVGADGEVTGGSGQLKGLTKGAEYPVVSAGDALNQLNKAARAATARSNVGGCATPVPLEEGELKSPGNSCGARTGAEPATTTVMVDKAVFGLAMRYVDGEQTLVPSWLFSVHPAAGGTGSTIAQLAVDPDSLANPSRTPDPERTPGPGDAARSQRPLLSYSADGRTLDVTFWGGVCSTYAASATESADAVRVTITESLPEPKKVCIMIAKKLTRTVTLDAPLGDRKVLDSAGGVVPRG